MVADLIVPILQMMMKLLFNEDKSITQNHIINDQNQDLNPILTDFRTSVPYHHVVSCFSFD